MPMVSNPDILLFLVLLALYEYSANLCSSEDFYTSGILYFGIFCGKKRGVDVYVCLPVYVCLCIYFACFLLGVCYLMSLLMFKHLICLPMVLEVSFPAFGMILKFSFLY